MSFNWKRASQKLLEEYRNSTIKNGFSLVFVDIPFNVSHLKTPDLMFAKESNGVAYINKIDASEWRLAEFRELRENIAKQVIKVPYQLYIMPTTEKQDSIYIVLKWSKC